MPDVLLASARPAGASKDKIPEPLGILSSQKRIATTEPSSSVLHGLNTAMRRGMPEFFLILTLTDSTLRPWSSHTLSAFIYAYFLTGVWVRIN